jgi:hypothetical protein
VVILMQENRSFDHYFGTLSGVRGFSDPNVLKNANGTPIFDQYGYQPGSGPSASGYLQPFRLLNDPPSENGEDTNDIDHSWPASTTAGTAASSTRSSPRTWRPTAPPTVRSAWATSPAASSPSTTRSPTRSRRTLVFLPFLARETLNEHQKNECSSATATTARCSAPPTRTA